MFEISVTETFGGLYCSLPSAVQKKADAKTKFFRQNPFHPSLRTKKLEPRHEEVWSFWVGFTQHYRYNQRRGERLTLNI